MKPLALALAVVFVVLAIMAFVGVNAGVHALGLDGTHHAKHAVLYAILAVLSLIWFRFQTNAATARP
jgi:hypothetical protein